MRNRSDDDEMTFIGNPFAEFSIDGESQCVEIECHQDDADFKPRKLLVLLVDHSNYVVDISRASE